MKIKNIAFIDENGNPNYYQIVSKQKQEELDKLKENYIVEIIEHQSRGEGDKWYYDVIFKDKSMQRLFNVNSVDFVEELK